ncbi:hypothetical protein BDN72DRAFT_943005 [Pluteus cervinus]|uniref:Uncharacterized protein n=1 Tax=Pluteus cervinus TaxID=181527 RepID=A0ACD3AYF8_9AGAR|nr:hypothetical protein BDN72DRAFT_943005 [Pluteus cervinus]
MAVTLSFSMRRMVLLAAVFYSTLAVVGATPAMHRPANYTSPERTFKTEEHPKLSVVQKRAGSKTSFAYFTNWGIYGANFQPTDIVPKPLTHLLYSFADVDSSGAVKLTDSYADAEKHFPNDSWSETGNNLYGCLKQLYLLKLQQRNLKVLLSIGGWTYSQSGHFNFVTDSGARATFVSSAVQLIEDYGFDGIDIDYESPASQAQGQGLADLVTALRSAFTQLQQRKGDSQPYLITVAAAAGSPGYSYLNVPQMDAAINYWNLMAYDFAGSWLTYSDNQANLYGGSRTGISGDAAVQYYVSHGATLSKINLGMPLYGRAFESTNGIGQSYNGIGPGTTEAGIYSYKVLPMAGAQVTENTTDVTSYSYDSSKKELVSYDTPNIVRAKSQYIVNKGLAGSMFWELSTDKTGGDSLVGTAAGVFGSLDTTPNHISYPNSKYDNLRNNFGGGGSGGGGGGGGGGSPPTTTSPPTSTPPPPPPSGGCGGVPAWTTGVAYVGGNQVSYGGHLWTAKWWTESDTPGGAAGVWTDNGSC